MQGGRNINITFPVQHKNFYSRLKGVVSWVQFIEILGKHCDLQHMNGISFWIVNCDELLMEDLSKVTHFQEQTANGVSWILTATEFHVVFHL